MKRFKHYALHFLGGILLGSFIALLLWSWASAISLIVTTCDRQEPSTEIHYAPDSSQVRVIYEDIWDKNINKEAV